MQKDPIRVILCNNSKQHFEAIQDALEGKAITTDIVYVQYPDEALESVTEKGVCIVVMDSVLVNTFKNQANKNLTDGTRSLAQKSKEKNSNCKRILYTTEPYDLKKEEFDHFIDGKEKDSYLALLKLLENYCKN